MMAAVFNLPTPLSTHPPQKTIIMRNRLIVITGPTGSGKSALAMKMAEHLGCDIISADSRQMFREIPIGTAAPSPDDQARVKHHFVGNLSISDYYSAAQFEDDVIRLLPSLWQKSPTQILCGGSMMYIDAVTRGIDQIPTISDDIRQHAWNIYHSGGLQQLRISLLQLDPVYYRQVDLNNHKRLIHAIEICLQAGVPYSSLRTGAAKPRDFDIELLAIDLPRDILFDRINNRVISMIQNGLLDEARAVSHLRHLNALNTVGYKELWPYFDGLIPLDKAIEKIQRNTRVYAKKQLTWLKSRPHKFITL